MTVPTTPRTGSWYKIVHRGFFYVPVRAELPIPFSLSVCWYGCRLLFRVLGFNPRWQHVATLVNRASKICSDFMLLHSEFHFRLVFFRYNLYLSGGSFNICYGYLGKRLTKLVQDQTQIALHDDSGAKMNG